MNMNRGGASEGRFSCWCMSDSSCLGMMLMKRKKKNLLVTSCDFGGDSGVTDREGDTAQMEKCFLQAGVKKMRKFILMPSRGRERIKKTITFIKWTVRKSDDLNKNNKQTLTSSRMMGLQYHCKH